jgi:adenosylhomocysteinase
MAELVEKGKDLLQWARSHMPVLAAVRDQLIEEGTLKGVKIGMALHTEAKTGVLALSLKEAGAEVRLASCNPLSTDDAVAAALREEYGLETYARRGETREEYYENLNRVLDLGPSVVVDDGGDLIGLLHTKRRELLEDVFGGNEETTTGIIRLRAMEAEGALELPVMDVNGAQMKHLFDNRYGTGQSTLDGIMTSTNLLIAGKRFVVAGYGWCGRGIAMRARGMGAHVIVTEVDPVRAVEAKMDGFEVMPMADAAWIAEIIVSATGCKDVVDEEVLQNVKDGCLLANSGHFDNEISKSALESLAVTTREARDNVREYEFGDGRKVYLLADGRLVNLVAGQGHPAEIMDTSFSLQALCAAHLAAHELENGVHEVPRAIDERVARLKLETMGVSIDALTEDQEQYLRGWREGT